MENDGFILLKMGIVGICSKTSRKMGKPLKKAHDYDPNAVVFFHIYVSVQEGLSSLGFEKTQGMMNTNQVC